MLHSVRTIAAIPDGLMKAKVELKRGMIVSRVFEDGEFKIALPSGAADKAIYGFVTLREDEAVYSRAYYDVIEANRRAVVYTLVKNEEWATDQVEGFESLNVGDKLVAGANGKLVAGSEGAYVFEVIGKRKALAGYENDTVIVKVL
jgi:hypothetical protein